MVNEVNNFLLKLLIKKEIFCFCMHQKLRKQNLSISLMTVVYKLIKQNVLVKRRKINESLLKAV